MPLMQLQIKPQKTAEITYLEENKQETRCDLTYLEVSKWEKRYYWCFEDQRTGWNLNVTFLVVINKKIRCALDINSGNCNKIAMVDAVSS